MSVLNRDELQVLDQPEIAHNRWQFSNEEVKALIPIKYKMYYNRINQAEFSKLDQVGQDKVREKIRNGIHAPYLIDVENEGENYTVGSGKRAWYSYHAFTIKGGKKMVGN